jgi:hypothetical protein
MALEQVPRPVHGRRGPADPPSQRLQDREPDAVARIPREELSAFLTGYGWARTSSRGTRSRGRSIRPRPPRHGGGVELRAEILQIRRAARGEGRLLRPRWPMIVLASAKGWTGPRGVDGKKVEGTFRAHQVPLADPRGNPEHLAQLERGCGATARRSSSTGGRARVRARGARARGRAGWARTRAPTAGCCCATSSCRTTELRAWPCRARGGRGEDTRVLGGC